MPKALEFFSTYELTVELLKRFAHSNGVEFLEDEQLAFLSHNIERERIRRSNGGTQQ